MPKKISSPTELLTKYGFSPEKGFSDSNASVTSPDQSGQTNNQGGLGGIVDLFLGPLMRSLGNIGTAATTIPQAGVSSLVSKFSPQLGAQIASPDIFGTQTRASEIQENPQEALTQQLSDSGSLLLDAATAKFAPKILGKAGELLPG